MKNAILKLAVETLVGASIIVTGLILAWCMGGFAIWFFDMNPNNSEVSLFLATIIGACCFPVLVVARLIGHDLIRHFHNK